jgi:MFS transporter, ACS family, tartrate transporter
VNEVESRNPLHGGIVDLQTVVSGWSAIGKLTPGLLVIYQLVDEIDFQKHASSKCQFVTLINGTADVSIRARRRTAFRLLPFVFLLYVVNYIDRVNVSFANLRMSADLGFSDRVYGLGVGIFYLSYVLFEIPGAILVERWSARKWIARIMVSWGVVTILTAFINSVGQFYAARFFLGFAEASFLPGMIVYLTHWFHLHDRSRAIACLFAAIPTASLLGSPLAGWLLGVHWGGLAGWRWLFILEGLPAIFLGAVTFFYLTDWPSKAAWLHVDERDWLISELQTELRAKKRVRDLHYFASVP